MLDDNGYSNSQSARPLPPHYNEVLLVASGDSRPSANETCWPAQAGGTPAHRGVRLRRRRAAARPSLRSGNAPRLHFQPAHGYGRLHQYPPEARVVVAEAVWQYTHHVLPGLRSHRGPILTAANWSGQWPGLVGMLNLNGSMYKAGVPFSTVWSLDFTDDFFRRGLRQWLAGGRVEHDASHVRPSTPPPFPKRKPPWAANWRAICSAARPSWASSTKAAWVCITPSSDDELLNPLGIYKERLSQAALVARMRAGRRQGRQASAPWLDKRGVRS